MLYKCITLHPNSTDFEKIDIIQGFLLLSVKRPTIRTTIVYWPINRYIEQEKQVPALPLYRRKVTLKLQSLIKSHTKRQYLNFPKLNKTVN